MMLVRQRQSRHVARRSLFDAKLLEELREVGVVTTDVGKLPLGGDFPFASLRALAAASEMAPAVFESEDILRLCPEAYLLGLSEEMLDLAEEYIGQECRYLGCVLKRERVGAPDVGPRLWHRDVEDERMLRILIYLADVDEWCGAFEHVIADSASMARVKAGYMTDEQLREALPGACRTVRFGAAGTAILFDGARIVHRAGSPSTRDRVSFCFNYTSRHPLQTFSCSKLKPGTRQLLSRVLDRRAGACVT